MSVNSNDIPANDNLFAWLKSIPLSRPIKNIARDLADGVLVAELVTHFLPRYVNLSNFTAANSKALRRYNWETLNKLVFVHLGFQLNSETIKRIVSLEIGAIEDVLLVIREKVDLATREGRFKPPRHRARSISSGSNSNINRLGLDSDWTQVKSHSRSNLPTDDIQSQQSCSSYSEFAAYKHKCRELQLRLKMKDDENEKLIRQNRCLEQLVKVKNDRLNELSQQLHRYMAFENRYMSNNHGNCASESDGERKAVTSSTTSLDVHSDSKSSS